MKDKRSLTGVLVSLAVLLYVLSNSVSSDILTGQVIVPNSPPSVASITLDDRIAPANIQLTAGSDSNQLFCDGIVTDNNGYGDLNVSWAYIYNGTNMAAATDSNERYDNASCSFTEGSGIQIYVNCSFWVQHQAVNGTWTCNITVNDSSDAWGGGLGTDPVDEVTGISVEESSLDFGTLALGASSPGGNFTNVTNQGNVIVDIRNNGTDYACTGQGTIPNNHTRFSIADGNYGSMSQNLTNDPWTETGFNLGIQGIATAEAVNSTLEEWWTIVIPASQVSGTCQNSIQITGTYGL